MFGTSFQREIMTTFLLEREKELSMIIMAPFYDHLEQK